MKNNKFKNSKSFNIIIKRNQNKKIRNKGRKKEISIKFIILKMNICKYSLLNLLTFNKKTY